VKASFKWIKRKTGGGGQEKCFLFQGRRGGKGEFVRIPGYVGGINQHKGRVASRKWTFEKHKRKRAPTTTTPPTTQSRKMGKGGKGAAARYNGDRVQKPMGMRRKN